ncbi:MAG: hypothetical protein WC464_09015 [Bdellovibrionales bacterium]
MSEGQILTREAFQDAIGGETYLTVHSSEAEIRAVLKRRKIAVNADQMKMFASSFRKAAAHLLKKWTADNEKGSIRPSLAALLRQHGMEGRADMISPSLVADWALNMVNEKRTPHEKPFRPDPEETQRELNRRYWTERLRENQRVPK